MVKQLTAMAGAIALVQLGGSSVAAQPESEHLDAEQLDAEQLDAEQLDAEHRDAEHRDTGRFGSEPTEAAHSAASAVELQTLLAHARRHSPRLAVARARVAQWRVDAAASELPVPADPAIQVGVGPRIEGDAVDVDVNVQVRQPLEIAGEQGVRRTVAGRARARAAAELEAAWFELHHAIHATYHRALIARERLDVVRRWVAFAERLVAVARRRVELGEDSPLDVQIARLEHLRARQRATHERQRYLEARLSLSELSGWPADPPPTPAGSLDPPRRAPSTDTLVRLARQRGPQLAVLRAATEEAEARSELAHREGWPEPTVGASYQLESMPGDARREHQFLGVLSSPLPMFHRNPVGRRRAEVELETARAERHAAEATLRVRVRRLAAAVNASAEQLEVYRRELVPLTSNRLELLEEAYRIGEVGILQVAAARDRVLAAQLEALDAYTAYFDAVTAVVDAVGAEPWEDRHHGEGDQ